MRHAYAIGLGRSHQPDRTQHHIHIGSSDALWVFSASGLAKHPEAHRWWSVTWGHPVRKPFDAVVRFDETVWLWDTPTPETAGSAPRIYWRVYGDPARRYEQDWDTCVYAPDEDNAVAIPGAPAYLAVLDLPVFGITPVLLSTDEAMLAFCERYALLRAAALQWHEYEKQFDNP